MKSIVRKFYRLMIARSLFKHRFLILLTVSFLVISSNRALSVPNAVAQSTLPPANSSVVSQDDEFIGNLDKMFEQVDDVEAEVRILEKHWEEVYSTYFDIEFSEEGMTADKISAILSDLARQTGTKPAMMYLTSTEKQLELVLVLPEGPPIRRSIPEASRSVLLETIQDFRIAITDPVRTQTTNYLSSAQQLYQWMIEPVESELQAQNINTLLLCQGKYLGNLPIGALHDGERFLVEKYSIARIPAFKLFDRNYTDLRNARVLAMGASSFENLSPLPAVPIELSLITRSLWEGQAFLNRSFTLNNLQQQRQQSDYGIIHLATHAEFRPGKPDNSYIQFWDSKLTLEKMKELGWNNPPVSLLVLSACRTALGDTEAELGFGGLAVQSGAKSALASLWYVSDTGTLALMSEFYRQLQQVPIKAEALRQAQIAMIQGKVRIQDGQLLTSRGSVSLPAEIALSNNTLSHPYYWAAFMIIGSPW
jgi:CHAT domain-containing protein